jgi:uncharacterized protein
MNINVAGLLKDGIGATRHYTITEPVDMADSGMSLVGPVTGDLRMTRTSRGVLVEGKLSATVEQACSRCLEPALSPVTVEIAEEFFQTLDMGSGTAMKTPDEAKDDPAVLIDGHHEIKLDDLARQYLVSWAPMHPLCRDDCAGLCPQCGKNRNLADCGCPPVTGGALSGLAALLKASEGT